MPTTSSIEAARLARALHVFSGDLEPLAAFLHQWFTSLVAQGFSRAEALELTGRMEDALLRYLERPEE